MFDFILLSDIALTLLKYCFNKLFNKPLQLIKELIPNPHNAYSNVHLDQPPTIIHPQKKNGYQHQNQDKHTHYVTKQDKQGSEGFQKMQFDEICPLIKQWFIQYQFAVCNQCIFITDGSHVQSILKQIQHVKFTKLTSLNLWGNNIQSIQGICNLDMPMLQELWIWSNDIVSIKPLRRACFPNLILLDAKNNKILQHQSLSELRLENKYLKRIDIGSGTDKNDERFDLVWIAKMELQSIGEINLSKAYKLQKTNERIRQAVMRKTKKQIDASGGEIDENQQIQPHNLFNEQGDEKDEEERGSSQSEENNEMIEEKDEDKKD